MKLGLYADPHFSQSSSIIVGRKGEFTGRLNNLIESFEWMNNLFKSEGVDRIYCLGDLTDKPVLTSEEITAMSRCHIEDHYLIVGNHCRADSNGDINSLAIYPNVINEPCWACNDDVFILPYNHETFDLTKLDKRPKIILSHNDIKGYDFGAGHICGAGYEISTILDSCDMFINGHLHSGGNVVVNRIINLGHLSAMNFASCNSEWEPSVMIIDTETLEYKLYENPKAYRFKKEEFSQLAKLKGYLDNLPDIGEYVLQVKVPEDIAQKARKLIEQCDKVVTSRILVQKNKNIEQYTKKEFVMDTASIYDKLSKFVDEKSPGNYSIKVIHGIIDKISEQEEGEA